MIAMSPTVFRHRRELTRHKKTINALQKGKRSATTGTQPAAAAGQCVQPMTAPIAKRIAPAAADIRHNASNNL
ncbi:hypothetical protein ACFS07_26995 [Undibacterium arcticum]